MLSARLLLLTLAIVAGFCALATAISGMLTGGVAAYPVFATAAFAGGALSARLTSRRSVVEGAIAATACGLITAVVNRTIDDLQLVDDPASRSPGWVIGAGAVCLVAAILGGRLGERNSSAPPGRGQIGLAFGAAVAGMFFGGLLALYVVYQLWGDRAMLVVELAMLAVIPVAAGALVVATVTSPVTFGALFIGSLSTFAMFGVAVISQVGDVAPMLIGGAVCSLIIAGVGIIGRPVGRSIKRRAGPVEDAPAIAEARVRE